MYHAANIFRCHDDLRVHSDTCNYRNFKIGICKRSLRTKTSHEYLMVVIVAYVCSGSDVESAADAGVISSHAQQPDRRQLPVRPTVVLPTARR